MMKSSTQEDERNSAQYKGVRKRKWGKWVSEIRLPNSRERIWLGSYDSAEKAARAFDAASFCLRGKGAKFNFPDNPPDIPGGRRLSSQEIQAAAAKYANEEPHTEHNHHHHQQQQQQQQQQQHCSMDYASSSSISDIPLDSTNMAMDWEFLDMLGVSSSSTSVSDFGVYSGMNDFPGEFLPPEHTVVDYGEENDAVFTQQSFLWNF